MYIPNDDIQNYTFLERLDNQLNEPTNQNFLKVSKDVKLTLL